MKDSRDRTYATALLVVAYVFAYADRGVVNVLLPSIKHSLGLNLVQMSLLQGMAFSLFFALAGLPLGRLADRYSRRNLLAIGIGLWSLATVACGLSQSFWQLFFARLSVGVGEASLIPASASLLADYYAATHRARALNFVQAATPIGTLLAMVGGGWLLTWLDTSGALAHAGLRLGSWQVVFLTLGAPGLVLALLLSRIREPPRREAPGSARPSSAGLFRLLAQHPGAFAGVIALQTLMAMESYALLGWAPTIYMSVHRLSAGAAGSLVGLMLVTSGVGAYVASGVSSDFLMRWKPRYGRIFAPGVVLPFAIAGFVWLYFADDVASVTLALAAPLFVGAMICATTVPAMQAITPNRLRGQAVALLYLVSNVIGLGVAPTLVAFVAQRHGAEGGLQDAMAAVCLAIVITGLAIWPFVLRAYAAARNYELEEHPDGVAATAPGLETKLQAQRA